MFLARKHNPFEILKVALTSKVQEISNHYHKTIYAVSPGWQPIFFYVIKEATSSIKLSRKIYF